MTQHDDRRPNRQTLRVSTGNVTLVRPEAAMFEAMVEGWSAQQISRELSRPYVRSNIAVVRGFRDFADGAPPWRWTAREFELFTVALADRGLAVSTLRIYHGALRAFCDYLTNRHYDWVELCEREFGEIPSQVCLPWNTIAHRYEFEGKSGRRPLTYDEVELLFRVADARVEAAVTARKKGALGALRDAQLLKTTYAFGLRRAEVTKLELCDLHINPEMKTWGKYGALHIRFAKAAGGGAPRRRTVHLPAEFDWWVPGMRQWMEEARGRFAPGESQAVWVTERNTQVSMGYLDKRFKDLREEAGLSSDLTLHSLRHSFVTHLLEFGYPERYVQEQAGHQHASTTSIYASVSSDYKNKILRKALASLLESERTPPQH